MNRIEEILTKEGVITSGNLFDEQKVFDVVVWGAPEIRQSLSDIEDLLIDTPPPWRPWWR